MALEQKERKHWVDALRGFCMVAILLDHTEIYFTGTNIIDYRHYVGNVLVVFSFFRAIFFTAMSLFRCAKSWSVLSAVCSFLTSFSPQSLPFPRLWYTEWILVQHF